MTTLNTSTLASIQLQQVIEQLNQSATSDLIEIYNEYTSNNGYDSVYDNINDSIDILYQDASDALRAAFYGDYSLSHAYFTFDGYGNLQSFEYLTDDNSPIDIEELAQWIVDNELYNDYDIEVTTLDDMLSVIEDSITDDESMLNKLFDYLSIPMYYQCFDGRDNNKVSEAMSEIKDYNYNQLSDIVTMLGIDYSV